MSRGIRSIKPAVTSLALALVLAVAGRAQAEVPPLFISVDEYGNGIIQFQPGGPGSPLLHALVPDSGPGGLPSALTYLIGSPPFMVPGDVVLLEPETQEFSDVLRFNFPQQGGSAFLVFYSDNSEDEPEPDVLADTGFPSELYPNQVRILEIGPEDNNYADYHPEAGQPGFIPGADMHYHFISDGRLPEPASLSLLALGSLALLKRRRTVV